MKLTNKTKKKGNETVVPYTLEEKWLTYSMECTRFSELFHPQAAAFYPHIVSVDRWLKKLIRKVKFVTSMDSGKMFMSKNITVSFSLYHDHPLLKPHDKIQYFAFQTRKL